MHNQSRENKLIFVDDLETNFHEILYLFEDLSQTTNHPQFDLKENPDKQTYIEHCEYLSKEIMQHQDLLYLFEKQLIVKKDSKDSSSSYWVYREIEYECLKYLGKALKYLKSDNTQDQSLEKIIDYLNYAHYSWEERCAEYFYDWIYGLADIGYHFSEKTMIFSEDNAQQVFLAMMQNALCAEKLYFSLSRNKNHTTLSVLKNILLNNRTTQNKTVPIEAQTLSGRSLITATISSVEDSLHNINQANLIDSDSIADYTGWYKQKKMNWNRETVIRGYLPYKVEDRPLEIKYQFQPFPGQLMNIKTDGVGSYGDGKSGRIPNILEVINKLTNGDSEKEASLAQLLLRYKRGDGSALSETELLAANIELPRAFADRRNLIGQFNKAAYLICFQEVYRRKNQGYKDGKKVPDLPFGVAISCILKLIADKNLTMQDVFSEDSRYGVFVGEGVMSKNLLDTIIKFNNLFNFFVQEYSYEDWNVLDHTDKSSGLSLVFTSEYFHQVLKESDGGECDSDNEDYNTSATEIDIDELKDIVNRMDLASASPGP